MLLIMCKLYIFVATIMYLIVSVRYSVNYCQKFNVHLTIVYECMYLLCKERVWVSMLKTENCAKCLKHRI